MTAHARAIALTVSVGVLITACERILPPVVEPAGVRLSGIGLNGATLIVDLKIENPNDFTIETESITFVFEASQSNAPDKWTRVANGTSRERLRIDAGDNVAVEVPMELTYSDLSGPVRSVIDKGTFSYRVSGQVLVREPRRTRTPYSKTGNLSLVGGR